MTTLVGSSKAIVVGTGTNGRCGPGSGTSCVTIDDFGGRRCSFVPQNILYGGFPSPSSPDVYGAAIGFAGQYTAPPSGPPSGASVATNCPSGTYGTIDNGSNFGLPASVFGPITIVTTYTFDLGTPRAICTFWENGFTGTSTLTADGVVVIQSLVNGINTIDPPITAQVWVATITYVHPGGFFGGMDVFGIGFWPAPTPATPMLIWGNSDGLAPQTWVTRTDGGVNVFFPSNTTATFGAGVLISNSNTGFAALFMQIPYSAGPSDLLYWRVRLDSLPTGVHDLYVELSLGEALPNHAPGIIPGYTGVGLWRSDGTGGFAPHAGDFLYIRNNDGSTGTGVVTYHTVTGLNNHDFYNIRFAYSATLTSNSLAARVWPAAGAEPGSWLITTTPLTTFVTGSLVVTLASPSASSLIQSISATIALIQDQCVTS